MKQKLLLILSITTMTFMTGGKVSDLKNSMRY